MASASAPSAFRACPSTAWTQASLYKAELKASLSPGLRSLCAAASRRIVSAASSQRGELSGRSSRPACCEVTSASSNKARRFSGSAATTCSSRRAASARSPPRAARIARARGSLARAGSARAGAGVLPGSAGGPGGVGVGAGRGPLANASASPVNAVAGYRRNIGTSVRRREVCASPRTSEGGAMGPSRTRTPITSPPSHPLSNDSAGIRVALGAPTGSGGPRTIGVMAIVTNPAGRRRHLDTCRRTDGSKAGQRWVKTGAQPSRGRTPGFIPSSKSFHLAHLHVIKRRRRLRPPDDVFRLGSVRLLGPRFLTQALHGRGSWGGGPSAGGRGSPESRGAPDRPVPRSPRTHAPVPRHPRIGPRRVRVEVRGPHAPACRRRGELL